MMNVTPVDMEYTTSALTDDIHTDNSTVIYDNVTSQMTSTNIPISRIIVGCFLFLLSGITFIGNLIVIIAFAVEKKLHSNFTLCILNLAITDVSVAITAMFFYSCDVLLGYWPFGEIMCAVWIFFDYGMTFASVFTLVAISVNRFWSVKWTLHFRMHNTRKNTRITLILVWLAVLVVWLAPCIVDRIKWSQPGVCKWEPSNNMEFVIFVAIVGHHGPCIILLICYAYVFAIMKSRQSAFTTNTNLPDDVSSDSSIYTTETSGVGTLEQISTRLSNENIRSRRTSVMRKHADNEYKIFVTLSYIILSYLVCWVPFHIVFDLSAIDPDLVPEVIYTVTFYLTYINSTLNPILYAYSSEEFQKAFTKVLTCRCCRK